MNALLALAVSFTRTWVSLYTLGLSGELREERRSEIDSDLWDQRSLASRRGDPEFGTAIEVLARILLGIFSDITWRAQAGASASSDRSKRMNQTSRRTGAGVYIWPAISGAVVLAVLLMGGGTWALTIGIPIGIVTVGIIFFRVRRNGRAVETQPDRIKSEGESRWRWLLLAIGVSFATVVGMLAYAFSLEEWGAARTLIFNFGGLLALSVGLVALVLLISDFLTGIRRKRKS